MKQIIIFPLSSSLRGEENINEIFLKYIDNIKGHFKCNVLVAHSIDDYNKPADIHLFFILSGGSEEKFKALGCDLHHTIYLLSIPSNNSLASSIEILSYVNQQGGHGKIIYGDCLKIDDEIEDILNKKNFNMEPVNIGLIGKPSDWLIASNVDENEVKESFNMNIVHIAMQEVIDQYNKISFVDDASLPLLQYKDKDELYKAQKLYVAIKNIAKKYNLSGLTIRCFDLISLIKVTACLALSILNDDGIVSACEGDLPSLITMMVAKKVTGEECFMANPSTINEKTGEMIFAHCTVPMLMLDSFSLTTHFESNSSIGIKGYLKEKSITIFKIANDLKHYYVEEGEIICNTNYENLCRTQIKIKLKDVSYFLSHPFGNHHLIMYGKHADEIKDYLNSK